MKLVILALACATAACAATGPTTSMPSIGEQQRRALTAECMKSPELFGFPNTRSRNVDLLSVSPGLAPNVYSYCSRYARVYLRRIDSAARPPSHTSYHVAARSNP
jgi:hypothetical protein